MQGCWYTGKKEWLKINIEEKEEEEIECRDEGDKCQYTRWGMGGGEREWGAL